MSELTTNIPDGWTVINDTFWHDACGAPFTFPADDHDCGAHPNDDNHAEWVSQHEMTPEEYAQHVIDFGEDPADHLPK